MLIELLFPEGIGPAEWGQPTAGIVQLKVTFPLLV